ncbi:MAG: hypothetical protein ACNA71_07465, partial [Kiritimatiellia bacterium]
RVAMGKAFTTHRAAEVVVLEDPDTPFSCRPVLLVSSKSWVLQLPVELGDRSGTDGVDDILNIECLARIRAVESAITTVSFDRLIVSVDAFDAWLDQFRIVFFAFHQFPIHDQSIILLGGVRMRLVPYPRQRRAQHVCLLGIQRPFMKALRMSIKMLQILFGHV